jgi:hypothetical protein
VNSKKIADSNSTKNNIKINKLLESKSNIIHIKNILQTKKKNIQEYKSEYTTDIGLYKKFQDLLKEDNKFVIPELFQEKYKILNNLEKNNTLNFTNYILCFKSHIIQQDINLHKNNDIIEEFNID